MSSTFISAGLHTLLVDQGRNKYRNIGINPTGPMDYFAFCVGNFLVGNEHPDVAIEFHIPGPEILFNDTALISITGPDISATIDGRKIATWQPVIVQAKSKLHILPGNKGVCGYICIHGGWEAETWLGSQTTSLVTSMGGFKGRLIKKGDELKFNKDQIQLKTTLLNWHISERELNEIYSDEKHICCVPGPEAELLGLKLLEQFSSQRFSISSKSNRMGYRLNGDPVSQEKKFDLVSSGVDFGTIQLLPDGQLIVLMADHQTTGGYPRLASITYSDLPRFTQFDRKKDLYFSWCTPEIAYVLFNERQKMLSEIKSSCLLRINPYLQK